jgi:hypothetical protein
MTADEYEDFVEEVGGADQLEAYNFNGTVGDAQRILKEQDDRMAYMYEQYRMNKLDPVAGDKSPARKRFLEKKLEEMEASGDSRLMTRDEMDELESFNLSVEDIKQGDDIDISQGMIDLDEMNFTKNAQAAKNKIDNSDVNREIKRGVAEIMSDTSPAALEKSIEIDNLMLKYPGMDRPLAEQIATEVNPRKKADIIAMVEQTFKMSEEGKSGSEIIEIFKNTPRTKQANGGRIGYAAGGGIMKIINKLKKLGKPKKKKLETVKDFVDRREFLKKSVGNSEKNKNKRMMDDIKRAVEDVRKNPEFKFKEIDIEKEIQPILNKGRKLHATGGIASMLGE